MIGNKPKGAVKSLYTPSEEVRLFTKGVKQDYQRGYDIHHHVFPELNDETPINRADIDQRAFNTYVEPMSSDPDEQWRSNHRRPIIRNKIISLSAHLTAVLLYPNAFAQNDLDEEDKKASQIMRDMIMWNIRNSEYESSILFGVIASLVNPATYMEVSYDTVMQKVKRQIENGDITTEEIMDEVLSGMKYNLVPLDEMMITNVYEFEMQKQKALLRKRLIDYSEVEALYGNHENFDYLQEGVLVLYDDDDSLFYDTNDETKNNMLEEITYYNRRDDTEVCFVNGVYMGTDNVDDNMMSHRDNKGRPKYPIAKMIHEPIDERRFHYGKSAVFKMIEDERLVTDMWRLSMDSSIMDLIPPVAISGEDDVDSSIMMPGMVTGFSTETKITPMGAGRNTASGFKALQEAERSISESSQDNLQSGQPMPGQQTAFEISRLEKNASIQLGIVGKMIGNFVRDIGDLTVDNILLHQTVGDAEEILGGYVKMNFKAFLLDNVQEQGRTITKKIEFTDKYANMSKDDETIKNVSYAIMKEQGGPNSDVKIIKVNPHQFSKLKFKLYIEPDMLMPKNEAFEKAIKLEGYDRMIMNPMIDQEAVTKDFLVDVFAKGDTDKYMKKAQDMMGALPPSGPGAEVSPGNSPMVDGAMKSNRGALEMNLADLAK